MINNYIENVFNLLKKNFLLDKHLHDVIIQGVSEQPEKLLVN